MPIDNTECPKRMSLSRNKRGTGVETDVRISGYQWILLEATILLGVSHNEDLRSLDRVRAE